MTSDRVGDSTARDRQEERPVLELNCEEAAILFQRLLLMQHLWTGEDARIYHKLRDWLRRQRQVEAVDENANRDSGLEQCREALATIAARRFRGPEDAAAMRGIAREALAGSGQGNDEP